MTSIEYDWWVLNADRDSPEVADIMAQISPGYNPDKENLYLRTEWALLSATLALGHIPEEAKSVRPAHFSGPVGASVWYAMMWNDTFDQLAIRGSLHEQAGMESHDTAVLMSELLDDFSPVDMIGYYARRVMEGAIMRRTTDEGR